MVGIMKKREMLSIHLHSREELFNNHFHKPSLLPKSSFSLVSANK